MISAEYTGNSQQVSQSPRSSNIFQVFLLDVLRFFLKCFYNSQFKKTAHIFTQVTYYLSISFQCID